MISRARKAFRLQLLPLVVGFVILAAIVGTRSLLIESQQADNQAVRSAFELERHIVQTLSLLQDAESGQRGYLLTGNESYLEPYNNSVTAMAGEMDVLGDTLVGTPSREAAFQKLTGLVDDKLHELAQSIGLYREGKQAEAIDVVRSNAGKAYMDQIREVIGTSGATRVRRWTRDWPQPIRPASGCDAPRS